VTTEVNEGCSHWILTKEFTSDEKQRLKSNTKPRGYVETNMNEEE